MVHVGSGAPNNLRLRLIETAETATGVGTVTNPFPSTRLRLIETAETATLERSREERGLCRLRLIETAETATRV